MERILELTPRRLWFLGFFGFLYLAAEPLAWTRYLLLFFLAPLLADFIGFLRKVGAEDEWIGPDLPLPGPAARGGAILFHLRYILSSNLTFLNPTQRRQVLSQIRGERLARKRVSGRAPKPGSYDQKAEYTLPFAGQWLVMNGGMTPGTSHSWDLLAQRYAYDFVIAHDGGQRHFGNGLRMQDYFCYGKPVLAPADGEVVEVVKGVRDAPRVGTGWVDWRSDGISGNSLTIRHASGEYSYMAHLSPGTIRVQPGQSVRRGEEVGRCGHSGHSTEPHLHFQVQDHADFYQAVSLPIKFSHVFAGGNDRAQALYLSGGMQVSATSRVRCRQRGDRGAR